VDLINDAARQPRVAELEIVTNLFLDLNPGSLPAAAEALSRSPENPERHPPNHRRAAM
jgi:hypothetical protein